MQIRRTDRDKFFDGVGVPPGMLHAGLQVMVPVGTVSATVNGGASIVALAVAIRPADVENAWWFDVYLGGPAPLPQMYPIEQLLGIPAHGISTTGLEDRPVDPPTGKAASPSTV